MIIRMRFSISMRSAAIAATAFLPMVPQSLDGLRTDMNGMIPRWSRSRMKENDRPPQGRMLKPEDIEIQVGRAVGGDFMKVVHKPTGISRSQGPPLKKPGKAQHD